MSYARNNKQEQRTTDELLHLLFLSQAFEFSCLFRLGGIR